MAEKNSLWKNIRNKAKQNRASGATPKKPTTEMLRQEKKIKSKYDKGGPVGEDENGIPYRQSSIPMEDYEWKGRPENHVKEPVKKSTTNKSKSKEQAILDLRLGNSLYVPYNTSDYSEPKYVAERDASSTKVTPAMSTKPEPKDITSGKITLQDLDVITDVMQLGNFVPHPLGQAIGKLGSWGGAAIDGLQAYDAYDQGNYGDMAINIGSAGLGVVGGIVGPKFTRDMYNTTPGSFADKIASLGSRNGTYIPLTTRPSLRNNAVINKALNYNRGALGLVGAETIYDSKADGGPVNTLEGDLISKVIMNRNRDKDFVKRAYAVGEYPESNMFVQPDANEFGEKNSHLMSWGEDESGQAYMYPEVMNPNNEAVKVPNQYADYISSTGYKKATGIPHAEGGYFPTQGPPKALFKGYAEGGKYLTVDGQAHRVYRNADDDIMVNHPKEDLGKWDTINLTDKSNANTIAEGVASVKKWHRENPSYAQGGYTNPYNQYQDDPYLQYKVGGKVWQDIGAGAYGVLKGTLGTVTGGLTDPLMDKGYDALQKAANKNFDPNDPEDLKAIKEINTVKGAGQIGGAVLGGVVSGNVKGAVSEGIGGATDIVNSSNASDSAKQWTNTIGGLAKTGLSMGSGTGTGFKGVESAGSAGSAIEGAGNTAANSVGKIANSAGSSSSGFGDVLSNFSGSKFGQTASKAMPYAEQAMGMVGDNKGSLMEQGQAQQDFINSPDQLALKQQRNQDYINQGLMYSLGGNITNNSLNLRNTMRYKKFAQGGTFDQYGINYIPESAGLHHQSAYGGVPIGPDALAEGGEIKMDTGDGNYIVSDQVDGAETQKDFTFSKGGKYKELNRTLADGMKQELNKYTFGSLATSDRVKGDLRRPNDSYAQSTIDQIKQKWQQKTEYARKRNQHDAAIAQVEEQKRLAQEEFIGAYGGKINPKKYDGLNMPGSYAKGGIHINPKNKGKFTASAKAAGHTVQEHARAVLNNPNATPLQKKRANFARNAAKWKHEDGGYVHNQMIQPMVAEGGPIYGDPASEYVYAIGGMYGNPYYRGGQIDYTNDMYSSYAGGGPMPSNLPQAFDGPAAQNKNGMYLYPDGGMMPPEQQMMQDQQSQEQVPQEQMQQQPSQEQMMQMVQQVEQMLQQGAQPEQVMQQLVQSGVPQDMAMQAVQIAMQELQGQMQQQSQEQPMQGQEQMMSPQGMAHGGTMYYGGGPGKKGGTPTKVYTDPAAFQKANTAYTDSLNTYNNLNLINKRIDAQIAKPANQRAFSSQAQFKPWMQGLINTAVSQGDIKANLLQNAPVKHIQHVSGNPTDYTPVTATAPKVKPIFQPPIPPKPTPPIQQPPIQQPPVEQPLPRVTRPAAPQEDTYVQRPYIKGHGTKYYNLNSSDPVERQKALEANKANQRMREAEALEKIKIAERVKTNISLTTKADGGMVSPQDGVSSQVAQQLKQGVQPQQVLQDLVQKGMPQEQAMAMVQAVMTQVTSEMQQLQQQIAPQQMMAARGGYFNGKKQYADSGWAPNQDNEESSGTTFSPLSDESTMSKIAGLGQAVVPALTSAFAFNKLSKRKIKPTAMEAVLQNRDAEINALRDEWQSQTAAGLRQQRNMGQTAGSVAGNTRDLILSSLKEGQKPIMQVYGEVSAANQQAQQQANLANKQAADDFAKENESMYQNAMQTGFEAAGNATKNLASYYADKENRNLQRWQAMNTSGEDWHWTPKGKAFRNKEGVYMINGVEVNPSTGNPI